jgi:hypothetical protein
LPKLRNNYSHTIDCQNIRKEVSIETRDKETKAKAERRYGASRCKRRNTQVNMSRLQR